MNGLTRVASIVWIGGLLAFAGSGRLLSSPVSAASPMSADTSGDVKALDGQVYAAIAARDATRLATMLDDGFQLTNTFGQVYDKKKFLAACCTDPATSKTTLRSIDTLVKTSGDSAAAVVFALTEMRFGQNQTLTWRSMRVYFRSTDGWKLVGEQRTGVN